MKAGKKAERGVSPIPEGYHTITSNLVVRGGEKAIEFYKKAFGAEEIGRMYAPDGKTIAHAELAIGDSRLFVTDEFPAFGNRSPESLGGNSSSLYLYVEDADAAFRKAVGAGAKMKMPVETMFWGDRMGSVTDPFGHDWSIATRVEDVPPEELERRGAEFFKQMRDRPS
jgi:PhnB protein